jgi:hypothetical protein
MGRLTKVCFALYFLKYIKIFLQISSQIFYCNMNYKRFKSLPNHFSENFILEKTRGQIALMGVSILFINVTR